MLFDFSTNSFQSFFYTIWFKPLGITQRA